MNCAGWRAGVYSGSIRSRYSLSYIYVYVHIRLKMCLGYSELGNGARLTAKGYREDILEAHG